MMKGGPQIGKNIFYYSDLEKTLLDFIVFKEKIDDSVLKALVKKVDRNKLKKYLRRYPKLIRKRVEKVLN